MKVIVFLSIILIINAQFSFSLETDHAESQQNGGSLVPNLNDMVNQVLFRINLIRC